MSSDIAEALGGEFDPNTVEQRTNFEPMPAGWYPVEIEGATVKATKRGDGKILEVELLVIEGDHAGRKVFSKINLSNPNAQAVEIGQRELASLSLACGISALRDSTELLQKQVVAKLKIKPADGNFEARNEVVTYKALDGQPAKQPAAPAAPKPAAAKPKPAAAAPAATAKRPWER